jgi:predicted ATPase
VLHIRLLGEFEVKLDGQSIEIPSRPALSLLAFLALNPGTKHRREKLAGMLWPDSEEENARSNLRHALWRLRKLLGSETFSSDKISVALDLESDITVDALRLIDADPASSSADDLASALEDYKGEPLAGFYDDWAVHERERIATAFDERVQSLVELLIHQGRWREVHHWSERWIRLGHSPEPAYRALMRAHAAQGDRASVAATYRRCVADLMGELSVEPSRETKALYEELSSTESALPDGPKHNLPGQLTAFIGRGEELAEIDDLLGEQTCRILTLVGVGGIGKTRLSIRAAKARLESCPDGVWLVELANLNDRDLVAQQVASVFGVSTQEARADLEVVEVLADHLRNKGVLIVLDNCEHLIEACADLVDYLLRECPQVQVLATSREKLGIPGEKPYHVPPMKLPSDHPSLRELERSEACKLFLDRAGAALPGFRPTTENMQALARICRRLDGIPLAIELAAARVRILAPEQIAEMLHDRFSLVVGGPRTALERHQTLRATMDWSYDLLDSPERALLRYVSVFSGGWTYGQVESLASSTKPNGSDVLGLLSNLIEKSLIVVDSQGSQARYGLLDTVRQYASDRLSEAGEIEEIRGRHAEIYIELAEHADQELRGPDQSEQIHILENEHENMRAALSWSIASGKADMAARLVGALGWFWFMRGYWKDSWMWLTASLDMSLEPNPMLRAKALYRAGGLQVIRGNLEGTVELIEEALAICRDHNDSEGKAWCLNLLGQAGTWRSNDLDVTESFLSKSAEIFRDLGDEWGVAWSTRYLGKVAEARGDIEQSIYLQKQALALFGEVLDEWNVAHSLFLLGNTQYWNENYDEAKLAFEQSIDKVRIEGDKVIESHSLRGLGLIAMQRSDDQNAALMLNDALEIMQSMGDESCVAGVQGYLAEVAEREGSLKEAGKLMRESLHGFKKLGNLEGIALNLDRFARLARRDGDIQRAVRLLATAQVHREQLDVRMPEVRRAERDELLESVRELLGEDAFQQAWSQGAAMKLDDAANYALGA